MTSSHGLWPGELKKKMDNLGLSVIQDKLQEAQSF